MPLDDEQVIDRAISDLSGTSTKKNGKKKKKKPIDRFMMKNKNILFTAKFHFFY